MEKLIEKLTQTSALTRCVNNETIEQAEKELGITFSDEYRDYLASFGVISFESTEILFKLI